MNERMLELYRQAHVPNTAIDPSNNMPYETTCFSAEKFAELIVRECAHVGFGAAYPGKGVDVLVAIKEHFGVDK